MLNEILIRAQGAGSCILPEDLVLIEQNVIRCMEPDLQGGDPPVPVMQMTDPEPCGHLTEIRDLAMDARCGEISEPKALQAANGAWHTIAQELENFPNPVPPPQ
jgi:hypothetical protein